MPVQGGVGGDGGKGSDTDAVGEVLGSERSNSDLEGLKDRGWMLAGLEGEVR